MPRIWFNRTYATNRQVIALLRANPDGRPVHVIGTHSDPDSPVLAACDDAGPEPELDGPDYVDWALDFARRHQVEVFFARHRQADLAGARAEFAAAGTVLATPDEATIRLFADKAATYRAATDLGLPVPPCHQVSDGAGLRAAHAVLRELGPVCVKPSRGAGGDGFRVLTTGVPELIDFTGRLRHRADLDLMARALDADAAAGGTTSLLVMPLLSGPEISVDAVADHNGHTLAAIGRTWSRRRRRLVDDPGAREVTETLNRAHRVSFLSNTQVCYWQGPDDDRPRPYLIELNTRISGGLFQTAPAGVNLPWAAVQLALDEPVTPLRPVYGASFTTMAALVELGGPANRTDFGNL